jgi:prophage antirepressor-like protein
MNQLQIFNYEENEVRAVEINGEPWFVLKDVCDILELSSPHKVAERLDDDERNLIPLVDSLGKAQEMTVVSESGVYNVIFRSDKPEAKAFRRWLAHEVLPAIHRTGKYDARQSEAIESSLSRIEANINFARPIRAEVISLIKDGMSQDAAMNYVDSIITQEERQSGADLSWLKSANFTPNTPKLDLKLYTTGQISNEYRFDAGNLRYLLVQHGLLQYVTKFNGAYGKYLPTDKAIENGLAIVQYDTDKSHPQVFRTVKGRDAIDDAINAC